MKRRLFLALALILIPITSLAQNLADRVIEHTLSNGLKVLMVERHQVPTVALRIIYRVGGANEVNGNTGIAHLYEHMAFKGTQKMGTTNYAEEKILLEKIEALYAAMGAEERKGLQADKKRLAELSEQFEALQKKARAFVIPNELGEIYDRNGAVGFNASTGKDVTNYMVSFPANRLPLWIAVESDRMANPVMREFYKEQDVVMEERRRSVESNPGGKLYEAFLSTAFAAHPYGNPILGWPSDVSTLSATETAAFFKTYYGPSNTIIAIVGDFKADEVIPQLENSFGKIPAAPPPPLVKTVEPPQRGERRLEVEEEANPQLMIGFHKPDLHHPDDPVFDVIDSLLSMGRTSRLYKKLVVEKKIVVGVSTSAGIPGARFPNLFTVSATPRAPHTTEEVEAAIYEELERLKQEGPTQKELDKVITNIDASLIRSLRSNSGLAGRLSYFEAVAGDWRYTLRNRDAIAKVTAEDVMRVAKKTFIKKNRTVATLVKKGGDDENTEAGR
ncbi:MAG: M16 family metallopeptidase [Nitrospiria bacterium]